MSKTIKGELEKLASVDVLIEGRDKMLFVGKPFSLDYNNCKVLICDEDKKRVNGIPQGTFLLAFYDNEVDVEEAILIRALNPTNLPTETSVISSMIEYYKDNLPTSGKNSKLDDLTRYEFSFSGLECSVLGTFYRNAKGNIEFGADLENFYSAHHYSVYKLNTNVLSYIVNQRDSVSTIPGNKNEFNIGAVRYSSSLRFQGREEGKSMVYINSTDLLGKRTALFGMTRTGKSNTVKKIIEATTKISSLAKSKIEKVDVNNVDENLSPYVDDGTLKFPTGQIIFDINGEYANKNLQDEGTAIFEKFKDITTRYSILEKKDPSFKIMKINFYQDISSGFSYILSTLDEDSGDYVTSFKVIDFTVPKSGPEYAQDWYRYNKIKAIYCCCLNKADFKPPKNFKVKFKVDRNIKDLVTEKYKEIDNENGITLDEAEGWFIAAWMNRNHETFTKYKKDNGKEWFSESMKWFSESMKALMIFLTQKKENGSSVSGYTKFKRVSKMHTNTTDASFEIDIESALRKGSIVIIDLSQGDPNLQKIFSERICRKIFQESMRRFTDALPNNFVQFYFEEAHNLFPKKDEKDLSDIYNRIAKEGAKLNIGMLYATQEVSSISSNILKNTQNWFIAHLNNEDETRELKKYYDFNDFADSLVRFSAKNDKGFVRMKTYSNPFVVPVQINKFSSAEIKTK